MATAIIAACVVALWLGWRQRLPNEAAVLYLAIGTGVVALYVISYVCVRLVGFDPTYTLVEVLLVQRVPPGSFFVVLGYLTIAYSRGALIRTLFSRAAQP